MTMSILKSKIIIVILVIGQSINFLTSCNMSPSYCEKPYDVEKIKLVPIDPGYGGKKIIIENDSLINFITAQICSVKEEETFFSSGSQGLRYNVEIRMLPNKLPKGKRLYVAYDEIGNNGYVLREGEFTYFKNDILCELVARMTETYIESEER